MQSRRRPQVCSAKLFSRAPSCGCSRQSHERRTYISPSGSPTSPVDRKMDLDPAMRSLRFLRPALPALALFALACPSVRAAQQVTLRNGSEFLCAHQEAVGDRIRLYLYPTSITEAAQIDASYIDVAAVSVLRIETVPDPILPATPSLGAPRLDSETLEGKRPAPLTAAETRQLLAHAGQAHNIDADLLA